jgi:dTDP-4-amino-4,6-dideoxygalactose transaminase
MLNTPFTTWPLFTTEEAEAVTKVLLSNKVNYWTGTKGREFEQSFAEFSTCKHAIAVTNGTIALDLAIKALDIGTGDEVIVTPRTFLASASSIINSGATPVFADIDPISQNITENTISKVITNKTKAIICVHLAGWPCEMDSIMALANQKGIYVIEDCAQAHGAKYKGRPVGAIGHIGAWSFCQDKIMSTGGEGGMVTTNDHSLWKKMWAFKDHGKSWDAVYNTQHPPGFRWLHESFGTNWRITEMQAAIGLIQLRRMPEWTAARQSNAQEIQNTLQKYSCIRSPKVPTHIEHAQYKFYAFIQASHLKQGWSRDRIVDEITQAGVPCYQGTCSEIYLEKCFDNTTFRPEYRLPIAKELGETSLMFLVHPTLTHEEIIKTCETLDKVLSAANK